MPDAIFNKRGWIGRNVKEYELINDKQTKKEHRNLVLPINLKPRVISWSFIKPEYLSLRQIILSLSKGSKFGISENITWLLMASRALRPVNMICIMWLSCSILEKVVALRLIGLSWRICVILGISSVEFFTYELMTQKHMGLSFQQSIITAAIPGTILFMIIVSLALMRKFKQT